MQFSLFFSEAELLTWKLVVSVGGSREKGGKWKEYCIPYYYSIYHRDESNEYKISDRQNWKSIGKPTMEFSIVDFNGLPLGGVER